MPSTLDDLRYTLSRALRPRRLKAFARDRLGEPLLFNLASIPVAAFGSFRSREAFELINRPHYAWGLLDAADSAAAAGLSGVLALEFGVAAGAGLLNMASIAERVSTVTGVDIRVVGFDTGQGMPPPADYRDHPDHYFTGDFAMDVERLRAALPPRASLVLGDIAETAKAFVDDVDPRRPIGFVALDVDYWSSTAAALKVFEHSQPARYLPRTPLYLDDITFASHNRWCGEVLAVEEFNQRNQWRKIERYRFLAHERLFRRSMWIDQIYNLHVLDHPSRSTPEDRPVRATDNPYLRRPRARRVRLSRSSW
jgi:hypothetical protein